MDSAKQQIIERIKQANNILVTVSANPSVDQLAGAIGVTLLLNHLGKHATAVFSGQVPSTIEFLQPDKTIEKNTDSLRDFIIALDKSKADKLRYKVEDSHVKIFITPYRTSLSQADLEFSQGDFNVELVLALGVSDQNDLDQAITAHGRILHDATVASISTKPGGELGTLNWVDPNASSLCEMLVTVADGLGAPNMDEQMATAFLTGVVAETARFSNAKTTSVTMSVSAKLMAAGANQQLVASKLEETLPHAIPEEPATPASPETDAPATDTPPTADATPEPSPAQSSEPEPAPAQPVEVEAPVASATSGPAPMPTQAEPTPPTAAPAASAAASDGSLSIAHDETNKDPLAVLDEMNQATEESLAEIKIDDTGTLMNASDAPDDQPPAGPTGGAKLIVDEPSNAPKLTANTEPEPLAPSSDALSVSNTPSNSDAPPLMSHDSSAMPAPTASTSSPSELPPLPNPFATNDPMGAPTAPPLDASAPQLDSAAPTGDVSSARDAVQSAITGGPAPTPEPIAALNAQPVDLGLGAPVDQVAPPPADLNAAPEPQPVPESQVTHGLLPSDPASSSAATPAMPLGPDESNPLAPPPVPPPMMPPLDPNQPGDPGNPQTTPPVL